jgi:hypothetical protein
MARGGGIFNQSGLALSDSVISNCFVQGGQGGETGSGFAGGGGNAQGGGIANIGTLTLTNCGIIACSAVGGPGGVSSGGGSPGNGGQAYGGAIYSAGPLTAVRCGFTGNASTGGSGGGGPGSGSGGGLDNDADALLVNCTVGGNSASGSSFDFGGGLNQNGTSLIMRCATVASNTASYGGGIYVSGAAADFGGCILADNSAPGSGPDCSGNLGSSDFNLVGNTSGAIISGATSHNLTGVEPLLGALAFNGGLGRSFSLETNSPAVNHGKSFGSTTDQRGAPRPYNWPGVPIASGGDGSDIGAFELVLPPLTITAAGPNVILSWPAYAASFTLQSVTNLGASNLWMVVTGTPFTQGDAFYDSDSAAGPRKFYKLAFP